MQQGKKHLHVIQDNNIIKNQTCFSVHKLYDVDCQRQSCEYWFDHHDTQNCVLLAAQQGPHTLQKIGQIYGLTRMRICQIEKNIYKKVRQLTL